MDLQRVKDMEQLKMLAYGHYVVAGLSAAASLLFLIHVGMGLAILMRPDWFATSNFPAWMGWFMLGIGSVALTIGLGYAALTAYAGRCLILQKRRTLILISAGLNCLSVPLGTALGIFTIILMQKPSVLDLFAEREAMDGVTATAGIGRFDQSPSGFNPPPLPDNIDFKSKKDRRG